MSLLDRLFAAEPQTSVSRERYEEARSFLEWSDRSEHFQKFLSWLDEEAGRPFPISDAGLVQGAVRANTLREVASQLRREVRMARNDAKAYENEALHG